LHAGVALMKKLFWKQLAAVVLVAGIGASLSAGAARAQQSSAELKLKVGDPAPDFTLHYFDGNDLKEVKLSDYRGKKNVVLAFYIFAFTGG
jgi:cytochrome oxidase Cu insertion factor (SCO1/SenC/PrrC family)